MVRDYITNEINGAQYSDIVMFLICRKRVFKGSQRAKNVGSFILDRINDEMVYLSQGSYQTKPGNSPYRNVEHIIKSKISTNPKTFENVYKKTILEWKTLNLGDSTDEQDEEINFFLADFFEKWKSANTGKSYENISDGLMKSRRIGR